MSDSNWSNKYCFTSTLALSANMVWYELVLRCRWRVSQWIKKAVAISKTKEGKSLDSSSVKSGQVFLIHIYYDTKLLQKHILI